MDVARADVAIPLLKPDEAMIAAALDVGRRIGVIATFPATLTVAEGQIRAAAAALAPRVDVICLAQFSMARARADVQRRVAIPVLTSPATVVNRLRALLDDGNAVRRFSDA
jgi:Asp/Glu/hydantoin racemase